MNTSKYFPDNILIICSSLEQLQYKLQLINFGKFIGDYILVSFT